MNAIPAQIRRTRRREPRDISDAADFGPIERRDVEREDRADIDNPNRVVRGGRVKDGLRLLLTRRVLTDALYDAAVRLRNDLAIEHGIREGERIIGGGYTGRCPADAQLDAIKRNRGAMRAIGQTRNNVVIWIVWHGCTLEEYATAVRCSQERARLMLVSALELLDDHYGKGGR